MNNSTRWDKHCESLNKKRGNWFVRPGATGSAANLDADQATVAGEFAVSYRTCGTDLTLGLRVTPGTKTATSQNDIGALILVPSKGSTSLLLHYRWSGPWFLRVPDGNAVSSWGPYAVLEAGSADVQLGSAPEDDPDADVPSGKISMVRMSAGLHYSVETLVGEDTKNDLGFELGLGATLRGVSDDDFNGSSFKAYIDAENRSWYGPELRAGLRISDLEILFEVPWLFGDKLSGLTGMRLVPFIMVSAPISAE